MFRNAQKLAKFGFKQVFWSAQKPFRNRPGFMLAMATAGTAKQILNMYTFVPRNKTDSVNVLKICQTGTVKTALSRG